MAEWAGLEVAVEAEVVADTDIDTGMDRADRAELHALDMVEDRI